MIASRVPSENRELSQAPVVIPAPAIEKKPILMQPVHPLKDGKDSSPRTNLSESRLVRQAGADIAHEEKTPADAEAYRRVIRPPLLPDEVENRLAEDQKRMQDEHNVGVPLTRSDILITNYVTPRGTVTHETTGSGRNNCAR
jgi:hypothetical protein